MQQDVLDVMARRQMPILSTLARETKKELPIIIAKQQA